MKKWFEILNKVDTSTPVQVMLYGVIGGDWSGDGVEAKAFKEEFDAIPKGSKIELRIHSPGGSVYDGLAIYNTVLTRTAEVTAYVDGLAASAASFIAMAASRVVMPKTSRMMIHDAQGYAFGDSEELKKMAEILDLESDRIADIYATKTGKTREKIRDLMKVTTWMDGQEAKDLGFADEVTDKPAVKNEFDLSAFRCVPAEMGGKKPGPINLARESDHVMNRNEILAMLKKHGVAVDEKATDQQLVALLDSTMGELTAKAATPAAPAKPETAAPAAAAGDVTNRLTQVEGELAAERKKRITAEVTDLCAKRRLDPADWIENAVKNDGVITALKKIPEVEVSKPLNLAGNPDRKLTLTEQCKIANGIK